MVQRFKRLRSFIQRRPMIAALMMVTMLGIVSAPAVAQVSYTCFPTCSETDARFLSIAGTGLNTLAGQEVTMTITSPGTASQVQLGIFDGDTKGMWDLGTTPLIYTIFADPTGDGSGTTQLGEWRGDSMPDNAWYTITMNNVSQALTPGGSYFYVLRIRSENHTVPNHWSNFKVRTDGTINLRPGQAFNITATLTKLDDALVVYPNYLTGATVPDKVAGSRYDGNWTFYLYVPTPTASLTIWDGDMDYGKWDCTTLDIDDPDTQGDSLQPWAVASYVQREGVAKAARLCADGDTTTSNPNDDSDNPFYVRTPSIYYELVDPFGTSYVNGNPSGNLEWEQFGVSTAEYDSTMMDYHADSIPAGVYEIRLMGMDMMNLDAWRFGFTALGVGDPYIVGVDSAGAPVLPPAPVAPSNGVVAGTLFFDPNSNGVQDAGEGGISGVTITLAADYNSDGTVDATLTTVTDANGAYRFEALKHGRYTATADAAALGNNLSATFDSDGTSTPNTVAGTIDAGSSSVNAHFGYRRNVSATVAGSDTVLGSATTQYTVTAPEGSTVQWSVTGGEIVGSSTGNSVTVRTGNFGQMVVTARVTKDGSVATVNKHVKVRGVDFALFAYDMLYFKGRYSDTSRGIINGNVGVNNKGIGRCGPYPVLTLGGGCADHAVYLTDGSRVIADYVDLGGPKVSLYDLSANRLTGGSAGAVKRHSGPTAATFPIIARGNLPAIPSFSYGYNNVTVNCGATVTLNPGKYGVITIRDGGKLNLRAGIYNIKALRAEDNVTINTNDSTKIRIAQSMRFGTDCYVGPSNIALFLVRSDGVCGSSVDFGYRTEFHGQVLAPLGTIDLGKKTDLFGRFWGKYITSDYDVNVTYYSPVTVLTQSNNNGFQKKRQETAVAGEGSATLSESYPNPFSSSTTIGFTLSKEEPVTLRIVDSYGNEVRTLVDNVSMKRGANAIVWDGRGASGEKMPAGTYFCQIRSSDGEAARPMVLVR